MPRLRRRAGLIGAATLLLVPVLARGWQARLQGSGPGISAARAVAIAPNGDVIAAGFLDQTSTGGDFAVVRLAADDGAERWRRVLSGPGSANFLSPGEEASAVAVDGHGDVVAVGRTSTLAGMQFTTVKLAGETGAISWRHDSSTSGAFPIDVAIGPSADAYVADTAPPDDNPRRMRLTRRMATTGAPAWTYTTEGRSAAVALHPSGDPLMLGTVGAPFDPDGVRSVVTRIDRAAGTVTWQQTFPSNQTEARLLRVTGDGDVYVGFGQGIEGDPNAGRIVLLSGATGQPMWSRPSLPIGAATVLANGDLAALESKYGVSGRYGLFGPVELEIIARADGTELDRRTYAFSTGGSLTGIATLAVVLDPPSGDRFVVAGYNMFDLLAVRASADGTKEVWRRETADASDVPGSGIPTAAVRGHDGALVVAGLRTQTGSAAGFVVTRFAAVDGATHACGDGVVDDGESCDVGNVAGTACCAADCTVRPESTVCDDGSLCTLGDHCVAGLCQSGAPLSCEPCGRCDPASGCFGVPNETCRHPTASDTAALSIERPRSGKARFAWRMKSGAATTRAELGDPLGVTGYAVCGFDQSGNVVLSAIAPPGGGAWRRTRRGFKYAAEGAPGGLSGMSLQAGDGGRSRFAAIGGGAQLVLPPLPAPTSLRIELRRLDDPTICWAAEHDTVRRNTVRRLRATGE